MRMKPLAVILVALLGACLSEAGAEDIDLFVAGNSGGSTPNVLFVIDNTANWNTAFTNEMAALYNTFSALPVNSDGSAKFNVGILFANETGNPNNNVKGGYVRAAIRPMTTTNRALYAAEIQSYDKTSDKGNGGYSALEMAEAYYYFKGAAPYAGNYKIKGDFALNTCAGCNQTAAKIAANNAVYALPGNALTSESATAYTPPPNASGCAKYYIIYVSNGPNQENASADSTANSFLTTAGGDATQIPLSPAGSASNPSDEWARFMHESSLGVVTYTIDVDPVTTGQGPGWTELLKSMASVSTGKYYAVSSSTGGGSQIANAINAALSEIQSVNSVFASVSLPVSVNTQGVYSNQVFIGQFRPDAGAYPRWYGNLKQYQINSSSLSLVDADGNLAVNAQTGFVSACARSFWTPTTADAYWTFAPESDCLPPAGQTSDYYANSNFPDGNMVEKGAAGYVLRSNTTRTMYTCSPTFGSCTSFTNFNTSNTAITPALLNVPDSATAATVIQWERGLDMQDENNNGATTTEMRPSVHGDVVHSRPAAINYSSSGASQVVVYYGGNDGAFRAINGNQTGNISGVAPGGELWSFVPPEFYSNIQRLYYNTPQIAYPNVTTTGALPKGYGIDGPLTSYLSGSTSYIYAPMRRGGRVVYAFDVSTIGSPQILWKVGCPSNIPEPSGTISDTGCTTNMMGMGQAWSSAVPLKAAGYGSGASPMLIMGGGYDTCEDADPNTCTSSEKGAKIYVLDATTGALLQTLSTTRAVVADVTVLNGSNGLASYAYAVDLGGNVYRITIGNAAPASWTITTIASLGCSAPGTCSANRKFMFAPEIVPYNGINMLMVGSGDREKPLLYTATGSVVNTVQNYFFRIDDKPSSSTWLSSESGHCGNVSVICLASLEAITPSNASTAVDPETTNQKGWYYQLGSTEQVVSTALTIYGDVKFYTHLPPAAGSGSSCTSSLGTTYVYDLWFGNATPQFQVNGGLTNRDLIAGGGLPPSMVAGLVTFTSGGTTVRKGVELGGCDNTPLASCQIPPPAGSLPKEPKSRVYWYLQR